MRGVFFLVPLDAPVRGAAAPAACSAPDVPVWCARRHLSLDDPVRGGGGSSSLFRPGCFFRGCRPATCPWMFLSWGRRLLLLRPPRMIQSGASCLQGKPGPRLRFVGACQPPAGLCLSAPPAFLGLLRRASPVWVLLGTASRALFVRVWRALSGFAAPGGRLFLAPGPVPLLWPLVCLSGVPLGPAVRSLMVLRSAFPTPWCLSPPRGLLPPASPGGCAGHAEAGREPGSLCPPLAPAEAGALGALCVVPVQGPGMGMSLAGYSGLGLGLRALRWLACADPVTDASGFPHRPSFDGGLGRCNGAVLCGRQHLPLWVGGCHARVLCVCGRARSSWLGQAGRPPGRALVRLTFPLVALSSCFARPPPGWGCPFLCVRLPSFPCCFLLSSVSCPDCAGPRCRVPCCVSCPGVLPRLVVGFRGFLCVPLCCAVPLVAAVCRAISGHFVLLRCSCVVARCLVVFHVAVCCAVSLCAVLCCLIPRCTARCCVFVRCVVLRCFALVGAAARCVVPFAAVRCPRVPCRPALCFVLSLCAVVCSVPCVFCRGVLLHVVFGRCALWYLRPGVSCCLLGLCCFCRLVLTCVVVCRAVSCRAVLCRCALCRVVLLPAVLCSSAGGWPPLCAVRVAVRPCSPLVPCSLVLCRVGLCCRVVLWCPVLLPCLFPCVCWFTFSYLSPGCRALLSLSSPFCAMPCCTVLVRLRCGVCVACTVSGVV